MKDDLARYWSRPNIFDLDWLEAHPNYPDWPHLAEQYRAGEIEPLIEALRCGEYAPPPELMSLLADVLAGEFKPPLRGKGNAKLTHAQKNEIRSVLRPMRRLAAKARGSEEYVVSLLREAWGRSPTHREVVDARKALGRQSKDIATDLARHYGVAVGTVLDVADIPRKRR
jgi:hypothetical protein